MIGKAKARFIRVSPRKLRQVLDIIRGKNVEEAFSIIANVNKGAAFYINQVLKSALSSAVEKTKRAADASNLFISKITADSGPMLKRYRAGSMGRAMPIKKRMSHILVELDMVRKIDERREMRDEGRKMKSGADKTKKRPSSIVRRPSKHSIRGKDGS